MRKLMGAPNGAEILWLAPVAGLSVLLFLFAEIVGSSHGISAASVLADYGEKSLKFLPLLVQITLIALLIRGVRSDNAQPLRAALAPLRSRFRSPMLLTASVAPLLLMPIMFSGYGTLKMLMPIYAPFTWDDAFADADRALFFGYQPWQATHWIFDGFVPTIILDRIYTLWVALLSVAILCFAIFAPRYDRARFFLSFASAWSLLGVASAYLLSSAGPCYSSLVGAISAADFAPLMERLHHYSETQGALGAVVWQGVLWDAHAGNRHEFGMGISAMPSLHNAIAVLYALALSHFGRRAGIAGWTFAFVIFVGSIHLGWHYAVDGIIATVAMLGIWRAAGWYLDRSGYTSAIANDEAQPSVDAPQPALA